MNEKEEEEWFQCNVKTLQDALAWLYDGDVETYEVSPPPAGNKQIVISGMDAGNRMLMRVEIPGKCELTRAHQFKGDELGYQLTALSSGWLHFNLTTREIIMECPGGWLEMDTRRFFTNAPIKEPLHEARAKIIANVYQVQGKPGRVIRLNRDPVQKWLMLMSAMDADYVSLSLTTKDEISPAVVRMETIYERGFPGHRVKATFPLVLGGHADNNPEMTYRAPHDILRLRVAFGFDGPVDIVEVYFSNPEIGNTHSPIMVMAGSMALETRWECLVAPSSNDDLEVTGCPSDKDAN